MLTRCRPGVHLSCLEYCESDLEKRIYGESEPESKKLGLKGVELS
eukprot:COSAG05_NODE_12156_length_480_cov_51.433071_1_plen_44_part_01